MKNFIRSDFYEFIKIISKRLKLMNEFGYQFRANLNSVKGSRRTKLQTEVDDFLRQIIGELSDETEYYSEEMLNEILFLQAEEYYGKTIEVYLEQPYPDAADEDFPFEYITSYECSSFLEAATLLEAICIKLKSEDFIIEEYDNFAYASENGKSFVAIANRK